MIEKEIFTVLTTRFEASATLQGIKVWSAILDRAERPFILYQGVAVDKDTSRISLEIRSDYQGILEYVTLITEIRQCLEGQPHEKGGFLYSFKEQENAKDRSLLFIVKRFLKED